jgi:hypothetical protein
MLRLVTMTAGEGNVRSSAGTTTFAMAGDLWLAREMLPVYHYATPDDLLAALPDRVIATALLRSGLSHPLRPYAIL